MVFVFGIQSLNDVSTQSFDASKDLGANEYYSIAYSTSTLIVSGPNQTSLYSISDGKIRDHSSTNSTPHIYPTLITDYSTDTIYCLAGMSFDCLQSPGLVSFLVPIDLSTGSPKSTGTINIYSYNIGLSAGSCAFSGYSNLVLADSRTGKAWTIDPTYHSVTFLGLVEPRWQVGSSWVSTGVVGYGNDFTLYYGSVNGVIESQDIGTFTVKTVMGFGNYSLGHTSSFAIDPVNGYWFYLYSKYGILGNSFLPMLPGQDFSDHDIQLFKFTDVSECEAACLQNIANCRGIVVSVPMKYCWLKDQMIFSNNAPDRQAYVVNINTNYQITAGIANASFWNVVPTPTFSPTLLTTLPPTTEQFPWLTLLAISALIPILGGLIYWFKCREKLEEEEEESEMGFEEDPEVTAMVRGRSIARQKTIQMNTKKSDGKTIRKAIFGGGGGGGDDDGSVTSFQSSDVSTTHV